MSGTSLQRVLGPWPQRMVNPIRDYDWGSRTALAWMQGRRPTGRPEAELWMGAHPSAPSAVTGLDGDLQPLDVLVEQQPQPVLGSEVLERFGARLPYLLKVLAFDQPLSVQVHPDAERAGRAWDGAANGSSGYTDPYPKPELLYALQPVDAMCGFRDPQEAAELITRLGSPRLSPVLDLLTAGSRHTAQVQDTHRLQDAFALLLRWPEPERTELAAEVGRRARDLLVAAGPAGPDGLAPQDRRAVIWASRLARLYPNDPLVAAPLLLDLIRLEPGEAMFVPAGAPHSYLYGLGIEIMASSDNVLRAGLTHKPIAVDELLEVIDGGTRPIRLAESSLGPREVVWRPPVEQFQLSRLRLPDSAPTAVYPFIGGPQVILCTLGTVGVATGDHAVMLAPGESAFVAAGGGPITVAGPGEAFRAAVGQPLRSP